MPKSKCQINVKFLNVQNISFWRLTFELHLNFDIYNFLFRYHAAWKLLCIDFLHIWHLIQESGVKRIFGHIVPFLGMDITQAILFRIGRDHQPLHWIDRIHLMGEVEALVELL